jgi:hypothetical protein
MHKHKRIYAAATRRILLGRCAASRRLLRARCRLASARARLLHSCTIDSKLNQRGNAPFRCFLEGREKVSIFWGEKKKTIE